MATRKAKGEDLGRRVLRAVDLASCRHRPFPPGSQKATEEEREHAKGEATAALLADPNASGLDDDALAPLALKHYSRAFDTRRKRDQRRAAPPKASAPKARAPKPRRRTVPKGYEPHGQTLKRAPDHAELAPRLAYRMATAEDARVMQALATFVRQHGQAFTDQPLPWPKAWEPHPKRRRVSVLAMVRARAAYEAIFGFPIGEEEDRNAVRDISAAIELFLMSASPLDLADLPSWVTLAKVKAATVGAQLRGGRTGGGRGRKDTKSPDEVALDLVNANRKKRGLRALRPLAKLARE